MRRTAASEGPRSHTLGLTIHVLWLLALEASTASAHHSFSAYDLEREVTLEGTVTAFEWRNPHVLLTVQDRTGAQWRIETDAPATMHKSRWRHDSFAAGDNVSVRFNPSRDVTVRSGLLVTARGPDWVSRSSVSRSHVPSALAAMVITVLALLVAAGVAWQWRRHRGYAPVLVAGLGTALSVSSAQLTSSLPALVVGTALLIGAAVWTRRRIRTGSAATQ